MLGAVVVGGADDHLVDWSRIAIAKVGCQCFCRVGCVGAEVTTEGVYESLGLIRWHFMPVAVALQDVFRLIGIVELAVRDGDRCSREGVAIEAFTSSGAICTDTGGGSPQGNRGMNVLSDHFYHNTPNYVDWLQ